MSRLLLQPGVDYRGREEPNLATGRCSYFVAGTRRAIQA